MAKTRLVLNLQVLEPDTDLDLVVIGSSRFSDDVWDLKPFIPTKQQMIIINRYYLIISKKLK